MSTGAQPQRSDRADHDFRRAHLRRRALLQGALGSLLAALVGARPRRRSSCARGDPAAPTPIVWIGHC